MSEKEKFYRGLNAIIKAPVSVPWYVIKKTYSSIKYTCKFFGVLLATLLLFSACFIYFLKKKMRAVKLTRKTGLTIKREPFNKWFSLFISAVFASFYRDVKLNLFLSLSSFFRADFKRLTSSLNYLNELDGEENTEHLEMKVFDLVIEEYKTKDRDDIIKTLGDYRKKENNLDTSNFYLFTFERLQREKQERIERENLAREENIKKEKKLDDILNSLNNL